MESTFTKLETVNVNWHTEKKGRFTYLSWPFAVSKLRRVDPKATWEVVKYEGKPFCESTCGFFVEVAVTVDGVTLSQVHPVLDNQNKPISKPNAFHINTSIQRCLVKAIALHGLGLYIYAGEDLPIESEAAVEQKKEDVDKQVSMKMIAAVNASSSLEALESVMARANKQLQTMPKDLVDNVNQAYDFKYNEFQSAK